MRNDLHEKIFAFFENYRKENTKFTYWLRERNTKGRLDEGMWFQGDDNYVSVGLYNRQSGNLSTQSISLVFKESEGELHGFLEFLFKNEQDKKVLKFYKEVINKIGGFEEDSSVCFRKHFKGDAFKWVEDFLNKTKPIIDSEIKKKKLNSLLITEDVFQRKIDGIFKYRQKEPDGNQSISTLLVNISWNSNDWQGETNDPSNHSWVKSGGTAHESWNFDFENPRNTHDKIYGFAKFTNTPKVSGNNNLLIFYSKNKIVGFYGKAQVVPYSEAINENNLIGYRPICILLKNKIDDVKEKGYLEDGKRIGQGGFNYLRDQNNIAKILDEAILLNPDKVQKLQDIKNWMNIEMKKETNYWLFQANPSKIYRIKDALEDGVLSEWLVKQQKHDIKLGDRVVMWLSGNEGGVFAIATVTSNVFAKEADEKEQDYYIDKSKISKADRVTLRLDLNLIQKPISKQEIENVIQIENIINPRQNINFPITKEQFKKISEMAIQKFRKNNPLNQILFGPPGTGKTFNTINKALEIINDEEVIKLDWSNRTKVKELFDKKLNEGQIVFTTFHQSMSYEEFIEGIKPETGDQGQVIYDVKPGIFLQIAENCKIKGGVLFEESYNDLIKELSNSPDEYQELKTPKGRVFRVKVNSNQNLSLYTSDEIKYQGVLSKEKLKKEFYSGDAFKGWEGYASAVLNFLVSNFGLSKPKTSNTEKIPHVLIIDEINRGNISQIFGELITLIEEDKRLGKDEALEVTLPYSKEKFGVPQNLYIIGTMNTADRSIEAIDTALRRRFSFTEMPPNYELQELNYEYAGTTGNDILKTINKRIQKLLDKDHLIGHSYFMKKENEDAETKLMESFYRNIIPLLQEYFFGDYAKIGAVLGSGFVKIKEEKENEKLFAEFEGFESGDYLERNTYQIIDYRQVETQYSIEKDKKSIAMDFEKAIKLLMNAPLD